MREQSLNSENANLLSQLALTSVNLLASGRRGGTAAPKKRSSQAPRGSSVSEKIAFYSVKVGGCVYWKHHWDQPDVRAYLRHEGKPQLVARLVWEKARGPIPLNKVVVQACGHRGCIRLHHLTLNKKGRAGTR